MDFATLLSAAMRKRAAAILTPEAMQAAGAIPEAPQGGMMPPQGMSPDMGGMPPQEMPQPDMQQGMAMQGVGSGGGQIPPEIMQDQQFIQWLASQGIQLNLQTGQFTGPDGQDLPVDAVVQAYQEFQAMMQQEAAEFGAFIADQGAEQCGFCNPGMIMNAIALLRENSEPTEEEIKEFLAGNLCRCSGYEGQLRGIQNFIAWKKAQAQA